MIDNIYYKKYLTYKKKYMMMQDMIGGLDLKTFLTNRLDRIKNTYKITLANLLLEKETQMSNNSNTKEKYEELVFYIKHETKYDKLKNLINFAGINVTNKTDDIKTIVLSKKSYIKLFIWLFSDVYRDMDHVRIENNPPTIKFDTPLTAPSYFRSRLPFKLVDSLVDSPISPVPSFIPVIYERP